MSIEKTQEPQDYARASQNPKPDGKTAHADVDGVVSIYVERLRRPEHQDGEEIAPGDEGDYEREAQGAGFSLQSRREDGMACSVDFPEAEHDKEGEAEDEWDEDVSGCPVVLLHS